VINVNAGEVAGLVTDSVSGLPLTDVLVELLDGPAVIASDLTLNGIYSLQGVLAGTYDLRASADFYETKVVAGVEVEALQVLEVDVELAASWGNITGIVTNSVTHRAVEGVVVELNDGDVLVGDDITDADGSYYIDSIVSGTYDLKGVHAEYELKELPGIVIDARETLGLDFDMSPFAVCGDADGSGEVDIDDVVFLTVYIFSSGPPPDPMWSGDADCSGEIDIDDVVYLVQYIFSGGPAPCALC
jgi:hypothetical protein